MKTTCLKLFKKIATMCQSMKVYENFYFQGFWSRGDNVCRASFFRIASFSEHFLPTVCEYSISLPLTKLSVIKNLYYI